MTSISSQPVPVRVGLAGAGPWARAFHAPLLSAGPETRLESVWARRPDAAAALGSEFGARAVGSFDELLAEVDAVAFCVPPAVQADLAVRAARAGKALLLEKPLAADYDTARHLVDEIHAAGVGTLLVLTGRFDERVRSFLTGIADFPVVAGHAWRFSGAVLSGPFAASPWRKEQLGVLHDLAPHSLDLLDTAVGPIRDLEASPFAGGCALTLHHDAGQVSQVLLSASVGGGSPSNGVRLVGPNGIRELDTGGVRNSRTEAALRAEFARVARGGSHDCDADRGLLLARLLDRAARQLASA